MEDQIIVPNVDTPVVPEYVTKRSWTFASFKESLGLMPSEKLELVTGTDKNGNPYGCISLNTLPVAWVAKGTNSATINGVINGSITADELVVVLVEPCIDGKPIADGFYRVQKKSSIGTTVLTW